MARFQFTSTTLSLRYQPLFAVAVAFTAGVPAGHWLNINVGALFVILSALVLASIGLFFCRIQPYLLILIGIVLAGATLARIEMMSVASNRLRAQIDRGELKAGEPAEITGTLIAPPEKAPQKIYLNISVDTISQQNKPHVASGIARVSLFLNDEEPRQEFAALHLDYGTTIRALTIIDRTQQYRNPGVADFDDYLIQQGYDLAANVKSPLLIENIGQSTRNSFLAQLYEYRQRGLAAIDSNFDHQSAGILKAVLFGERHYLSNETQERFKAAGTFHILVIAGLHIAFAAVVFSWLLGFLSKSRWLRLFVIAPFLWSYVVMIGGQPPAVRATLVVTIALIADALFRAKFGINTIAAAALVLLAIKPSDLFTGSFQLTFVTVSLIGLVAVPLIERMRAIGEWRPRKDSPYPPNCNRVARWLSEVAYWRQSDHTKFMQGSPVQYRLDKARTAILLDRLHIQWVVRWMLSAVIISTAIQLGLLPVMVIYFNRVTLIGIMLNIPVAIFMVAFLICCGLFLLTKTALPAVAGKVYVSVEWSRFILTESFAPFVRMEWASFRVPHYSGIWSLLYIVYFVPIVYAIILLHRWDPLSAPKQKKISQSHRFLTREVFGRPLLYGSHLCIAAIAVAMFAIITVRPIQKTEPGKLSVSFLDVGQGDSIFIRFPQGKTMLVDAGGTITFVRDTEGDEPFAESSFSIGESVVSRYLWSQGINHIDYIMATHGDSDHIEGFTDVIKNFRIDQAYTGVIPSKDPEFNTFKQALDIHSVPLQVLTVGDQLTIDGVRIEALSPPKYSSAPIQSENNDSLVLRLTYGERRIILTGDAEREAEGRMLALGDKLKADVLKVPHHGSRTSSTQAFLDAVHPQYAVISVGEYSRFGHPNSDVVERYLRAGIHLYQTGRNGTVTITTDGHSLTVNTFVPSEEIKTVPIQQ